MPTVSPDERSAERRLLDDEIAAEKYLPPLKVSPGATPEPAEAFLRRRRRRRRPQAFLGVVEKGLIRPVDPDVRLPENASVIIVTASSVE